MSDGKLKEYEEYFKSNIESPFELEMIIELIDEVKSINVGQSIVKTTN